jgi:transcriptional regulator with XRE-family HTH domain
VFREIFSQLKNFKSTGKTQHLFEISAAPSSTWPMLATLLQSNDWSVKDTKAATVYRKLVTQVTGFSPTGRTKHLFEIHSAPSPTWPMLATLLQSNDWSVSGFAKRIGKSQQYLSQVTQAAEVYQKLTSQLVGFDATGRVQHLFTIHSAPSSTWPMLATLLQSNDWSVSGFAERIGKSKGYLTQVTQAATVFKKLFSQLNGFDATGRVQHLFTIHSAPSSTRLQKSSEYCSLKRTVSTLAT